MREGGESLLCRLWGVLRVCHLQVEALSFHRHPRQVGSGVGLVEGRDDATLGTPRSRHPRELRSAVRNMVAFSVTDPCFLDCGIGFLERHRKGSLPHSKLDEDDEVRCSWAWLRPKAQHSVVIKIQVS
jgi:hypothetical protein